jgi:4-hydroxybenzoate polyprenyltransferase
MKVWVHYFIERFHPLFSFSLFIGMALSAALIGGERFLPLPFFASTLVFFYIAFLLRLKNDIEDLEKDKVAYPTRCLAKGEISKKEGEGVINSLYWIVFAYLGVLFLFFGMMARFWIVLLAVYLWWLFRPVVHSDRQKKIWMKAVFEEGIIVPLTFLAIAMNHTEGLFSLQEVSYVVLVFGAFLTYEICRKLNPYSHPASLTPIHYYGFSPVYKTALGVIGMTALAAYGVGVPGFLWPFEMAIVVVMTVLFKSPSRFTWARKAAGISLFVHAWIGVLVRYTQLK